jgi:hypothetical protein
MMVSKGNDAKTASVQVSELLFYLPYVFTNTITYTGAYTVYMGMDQYLLIPFLVGNSHP